MPYTLVLAFCKNYGMGKDGKIPWYIPEDLQHFKTITIDSNIIMGRKTYESIGHPLLHRMNYVITDYPKKYENKNNLIFLHFEDLISRKLYNAYIIGGGYTINNFKHQIDNIIITYIDKEYECDTFFNMSELCEDGERFILTKSSKTFYSENEKCNYKFLYYTKYYNYDDLDVDLIYNNLVTNVLSNSEINEYRENRTNSYTLSTFGNSFHVNISNTMPILTTKYVSFDNVVKELIWVLKGQTNSKILESQGVNIWKENTSREFLDNRKLNHYKEGDIGPMYGYNLRHYGEKYLGCKQDYTNKGIDQLNRIVKMIKEDPFSRRIMMTTYNPSILDEGVLEPCHGIIIQFYVSNDKKNLSCHMYQRSADIGCGLPYNILSYSLLTYIIALKCDLKPYKLHISLGDSHIYENHINQLRQQIKRESIPFKAGCILNPEIKNKKFEDIEVSDFELIGYFHHPRIYLPFNV
jgi:dihydrofolate reductase/thymidylate synthase